MRVAVAVFSVTIAAAIVVGSLGISLGIRQKLGGELRAYGANVMVVPRDTHLEEDVLASIAVEAGVEGASGQLYSPVLLKGVPVELIGLDMVWLRGQGWKVDGRWPEFGEVLVGTTLRDALSLSVGDQVSLGVGDRDERGSVVGFVERGGPEDRAVIMALAEAQRLTGREKKLSAVLVRASSGEVETVVENLAASLPGAEVKTLRQVAFAEESFLGKIELLMALVTLVVLVAAAISMSSTMSATVLERMREIGLMMAIGGTKREIRRFYLAEGLVMGLAGGLAGYVVGLGAAQAVSRGAFQSFVSVPLFVLPVAVVLGVTLAVGSSLLPVAAALRNKPSSILRGE
jgi:putative ABC transport system permease protein